MQRWTDQEELQLLALVKENKTHAEIAAAHERTKTAIKARLVKLAVEYYVNDNRPIEQIQKFTGLSRAVIEDALERSGLGLEAQTPLPPPTPVVVPTQQPLPPSAESSPSGSPKSLTMSIGEYEEMLKEESSDDKLKTIVASLNELHRKVNHLLDLNQINRKLDYLLERVA